MSQWRKVPIFEVLENLGRGRRLQQGWSPQCELVSAESEADWAVLKTTAVQDGRFLDFENKRLPKDLEPRPQLEVRENDILLTCAGPRSRCGVITLVRATRRRLMISGKLYRFRANPECMDARFLEAFLRSPSTQELIDSMKTGISESGMNLTHERFSGLMVPVPPIDVQRRIVAKLDELLAQSRAAREQLEAVPALVEQYRQSVLAAAFRGDLTADWRKKNPDVEPASKLLERIRIERRQKWEAAELAKLKAKGKSPKDDKWKSKYVEPAPVDASDLPELPSTWCWVSGAELFTWGSGKFLPKSNQEEGSVPVYGGNGVGGSHSDALVHHRALIVGRVGANCGNVYLSSGPAWITDNAIFSTWMTTHADADYLLWSFRFADLNKRSGGSGQPFVSQATLDALPVALPPIGEQAQLATRLMGHIDTNERLSSVSTDLSADTEHLERALLAKAFRGELVS